VLSQTTRRREGPRARGPVTRASVCEALSQRAGRDAAFRRLDRRSAGVRAEVGDCRVVSTVERADLARRGADAILDAAALAARLVQVVKSRARLRG
jgi:hypothetical protein